MRVINKAVLDIETLTWEHVESEPYNGPWELCDRAASNAFKQAAGESGDIAATDRANANAMGATLRPFYQQEMNAQHLFSPEQTNELLTAAGAPIASSLATAQGQAASEAARTRNTSGFSSALRGAAMDRNNALANANLGVGAQDIMGAKELNQQGAAGMQGLYGTDTNAMLEAMGLQNKNIQGQLEAGKSGWLQNAMNIAGTVAQFTPAGAIGKFSFGKK